MKKIMFNDKYGLTQAVLSGRKTMTRRVDKRLNHPCVTDISDWGIDDRGKCYLAITYSTGLSVDFYPAYQIGEEIAIAQRYWDLRHDDDFYEALQKADPSFPLECIEGEKGCYNKMFVRAAWMPHRIRITDLSFERLQDISDEDCLKEGITDEDTPIDTGYSFHGTQGNWETPREAFAALIDKVSGKGTWEWNPLVVAYTFELI